MAGLQNGQRFPDLRILVGSGRIIDVPEALAGDYGVVLIYRGAWCPYCRAQLAGFQRAADKLAATGVKVVALSVDDEETTKGTIDRLGLSFPVGHSAKADDIAAITYAYVNDDPKYLQTTGFVLNPDGTILNAVYSSNAIGRLVAEDVIGMVEYFKSKG